MKIEKNAQKVRRTKLNLIVFLILICIAIPVVSQAQLLNYPQKIVVDVERDRLLVSNYGNGALVQIEPDGNQDYFVQNAGFVDGMDIVGNVVYGVGNNCKLYGYDLDTEQQVLDVSFPGGTGIYLSSVTSDSTGHLFISCPALHTIYKFRISDSSYWVFAQGNGLNRPNGIWLERENDRIVVIDDSPGTSIIHAISLSDSTVSDLLTTNLDRPDGIVRDVTGTYYIGGYYLPGLYKVDADFSQAPEMFFAGSHMVYPTYDPSDHSLLITYYSAHDWERVMLPAGILVGTVSVFPVANLEEVEIHIGSRTINPDETGTFMTNVAVGTFNVTASLEGYETITFEDVEFIENQIITLFFELSFLYAPENLEAVADDNYINLSWDHEQPTENNGRNQTATNREFQNFNVYRNINGGAFELFDSTTELSYEDILDAAGEYEYYVTAVYNQENESEASNIETVIWDGSNSGNPTIKLANSLHKNYPNPFNPETTISFSLNKSSRIEIEVFNIKGQRIIGLVNDQYPPGYYNIVWKGIDDHGKSVSSGLYFYKMKINGLTTNTRKMLLLK